MEICEKARCTGCAACLNSCSKNAIKMKAGDGGFLYPVVDEDKCIKCGKCRKKCPVNTTADLYSPIRIYAALDKNDENRAKSTSGGVFGCLSQYILKHGGYIFGAVLNKDMTVRHIEAADEVGLDRIRGSKYVQSEIGTCYQQVQLRLKEGKMVLFSGTPCQVAGLRSYLKEDYENLITVDILCHGVPSPGIFYKYVKSEEKRAGSTMENMLFRSKRVGWKKIFSVRTFVSGTEADWPDTFVPGFLKNYYLRESCYQCPYATDNRIADITLGDYWGYKESSPEYIEDDDGGISLVIINNYKGMQVFRRIKRQLAIANRTIEDAKRCNEVLSSPEKKPADYSDFWIDEKDMTWEQLCSKYIPEQDSKDWMSSEDRTYYSKPYLQRHRRHLLHCLKKDFVSIFKKMR